MRWLAVIAIGNACGCQELLGIDNPRLRDAGMQDTAIDSRDADTVDATVGPVCPASYTPSGTTSYKLGGGLKPWATAQALCAQDQVSSSSKHTHLAVIANDTERGTVHALTAATLWIGLTDRAGQAFIPITDEVTLGYPPPAGGPWAAGQPSNTPGEDCAVINASGLFDDQSCNTAYSFVCECDDFAIDPARF